MIERILPTKSVYAYYFPEIRQIISDLTAEFPHQIYLRSVSPGLDDFHIPILERYIDWTKSSTPGLSSFAFRYPTAGASEGIFHILAEIRNSAPTTPLYHLEGEYEGYAAYALNLGLKFTALNFEQDPRTLAPGKFFISNPSARDGNIISNQYIESLGEAGHELILDLTYLGLTHAHKFSVDHPNISNIVVSLSKPCGVYYQRIGFVFRRKESLTLAPNKWFKNILSLVIANEIMTRLELNDLFKLYRTKQILALDHFERNFAFRPRSSEVILLGHCMEEEIPKSRREDFQQFNRRSNYRFCLTPYFLDQERRLNSRIDDVTTASTLPASESRI